MTESTRTFIRRIVVLVLVTVPVYWVLVLIWWPDSHEWPLLIPATVAAAAATAVNVWLDLRRVS